MTRLAVARAGADGALGAGGAGGAPRHVRPRRRRRRVRRRLPAAIIGVLPTAPDSAVWEVRALFATADCAGGNVQPLALQRGWQLSGALAPLTHDWPAHRVGALVCHVAPRLTSGASRALQAERSPGMVRRGPLGS